MSHSLSAPDAGRVVVACRLTSPELRQRKETVIASLKQQVVSRHELPAGFAYEFKGSDEVVDELAEFVKTERQCCAFFSFELRFGGEGAVAWLHLTGPAGAKEFIVQELGL
ncbi:hypothetical protein [Hymenobacter ruricola]|uniref:Uncharacterized protein n=1 Tax=Hymenobacter ruricola TaxID=2791023 RepID=A0ABS0HZZ3_9BACT|nr:hypothetical protein [Hymenobacter ruricola]MBF9219869.1 hypothetical protein [Hymenobacter ruricola]